MNIQIERSIRLLITKNLFLSSKKYCGDIESGIKPG